MTTVKGTLNVDQAATFSNTITVGSNDTGHDVKLFGATDGAYMLWDESTDDLKLVGGAGLVQNGTGANTFTGATTFSNTITVGSNETGLVIDYDKSSTNEKHELLVKGQLTLSGTGTVADISAVRLKPEGIITTAEANTITTVSTLSIKEPVITKGSGSTITNATTLYIEDAPDEADNNYALWVDSGETRLDGTLTINSSGATISDSNNNVFLGTIPDGNDNTNYSHTHNVGIGKGALTNLTGSSTTEHGDKNTCIGYNAGDLITNGYNNTCIGYEADASSNTVFNEFTLGNSNVQTLRCADQTIASLSDGRDKKNIIDSSYGLEFVNKLRPVQFTWDKRVLVDEDKTFSKNGKTELGFIAQEFQKAMPNNDNDILDLVYESNPDRLEARYSKLIPILTKAIQDLSEKVIKLESIINNIQIINL